VIRTSRRLLVVLVAVAAVAASGCGGGGSSTQSLADYAKSVVTARDRADFALGRITKAKSKEEFINRMDEASAAIDDAASDLDDAGSAEGFEDETAKLVAALHQLSVDLDATAHDLGQPEGEGLLTGARGLNFESWDEANLVLASLIGQGIKVELIGRH